MPRLGVLLIVATTKILLSWPSVKEHATLMIHSLTLAARKILPSSRGRTSDLGIAQVIHYSPTLFQLSYRRVISVLLFVQYDLGKLLVLITKHGGLKISSPLKLGCPLSILDFIHPK
jgi:hypothetical protein